MGLLCEDEWRLFKLEWVETVCISVMNIITTVEFDHEGTILPQWTREDGWEVYKTSLAFVYSEEIYLQRSLRS